MSEEANLGGAPLLELGTETLPSPDQSSDVQRALEAESVFLKQADILRRIGRRLEHASSFELALFNEVRASLVSTPGHARYFADKLERSRSQDRTKGRIKYARDLHLYVAETLVHLPSSETVGVVGKMLEDIQDAPPPENPGRDMSSNSYMNPHLAAIALSKMGIRDYPYGQHFQPVFYKIEPWLEWWKEVKAGERTFSFEGQDVEYRFKPDGTWDTIPLVGIGDNGSSAAEVPVSKVREKKVKRVLQQPDVPPDSGWGWIIGATMLVLATVLWFSWKSSRSNR